MLKRISYLSLFPEVISEGLNHSLVGKAIQQKKIEVNFVQIRDFAKDKHKSVDDIIFGGGAGMLLKPDVLFEAWSSVAEGLKTSGAKFKTILMSPQGPLFKQESAKSWVNSFDEIILVCGHYEGVDERFIDLCVDEELSIGNYVLTGGELPAMVVSDVLIRLLPEVIGDSSSVTTDSLENGLLKWPQYTRPREFRGLPVPEVLVGGNHQLIEKWRTEQSETRTRTKRPDLWAALTQKNANKGSVK
jgi:tRNA (guanine37-N1)-methyltransferase